MSIRSPLDFRQAKLRDIVSIHTDNVSPTPRLTIKKLDGTVIINKAAPSLFMFGQVIWNLNVTDTMFIEKTYYDVIATNKDIGGVHEERWIMYVNQDLKFEHMLLRALGLSGRHYRIDDVKYSLGNITSMRLKLYNNATDLDEAEREVSDNFIADYKIEFTYGKRFDIIEERSTLESVNQ